VLQWARANGCPWDAGTCTGAALRGHLEVLQWARANGCPWNKWTCIRRWRVGTSSCSDGRSLTEHLATGIPYSWRRKKDTSRKIERQFWHLELFRWARANGACCEEDTVTLAKDGGYVKEDWEIIFRAIPRIPEDLVQKVRGILERKPEEVRSRLKGAML
jgi:hypothetical protein